MNEIPRERLESGVRFHKESLVALAAAQNSLMGKVFKGSM